MQEKNNTFVFMKNARKKQHFCIQEKKTIKND